MALKRAADEHSPSVDAVNGDHSRSEDARKRQRTDSTQSWQNSGMTPTTVRPAVPLTQDEQDKLRKWLDKKAATDELPFPVTYPKPDTKSPGKGKKPAVRRKSGNALPEKKHKETLTLDAHKYGEIAYTVGNKAKWDQLTKYRRCTVSEQTFVVGACVLVRSDETDGQVSYDSLSQWKAQIHEVRALDANHVYLRVSWLLRPAHDLPGGPKSYHGVHELIPSTNMDIIDAKTINAPLSIRYWDEYEDTDVQFSTEYFWRQSYDHIVDKLTECRSICSCAQPQNPDRPIVQCPNTKCSVWLHTKCLELGLLEKYLEAHPDAGLAVNGHSGKGAHPKLDGRTKKARLSKFPDLNSETKAAGVVCKIGSEDGKLSAMIDDLRGDGATIEDTGIQCLVCERALDG